MRPDTSRSRPKTVGATDFDALQGERAAALLRGDPSPVTPDSSTSGKAPLAGATAQVRGSTPREPTIPGRTRISSYRATAGPWHVGRSTGGSVPARPKSVTEARHSIEDYIRLLGPRYVGGVALAVSEAVANAVRHAYRVHEPGTIHLRAELLVPDTLSVVVIDDGHGMSPHPGSEGLRLGLALMSSLTTELEIDRHEPHGTVVRMRFSLRPGERAAFG